MFNAFSITNNDMSKMIAMSNTNYDILVEIVNEVIGNGGPSGVFDTLQELNDRYPKGAKGVYLVTVNGKWYYWNGSEWVAGGVYQATQLADGSVTDVKLDIDLQHKINSIEGIGQKAEKANVDLASHKASSQAHNAAAITYSGQVQASDVKEAIDKTNARISNIVAQAGDSNTEIVDARGGAPVLGDRLNGFDAQLADIAINVKSFGAKGDGITDDTDAINAAINYLNSLNGGVLYFPGGVYLVSSQIIIGSNLTFKGKSAATTTIKHNGGSFNYILFAHQVSNLSIENLTFEGVKSHNNLPVPTEYGYGIRFGENSSGLYVKDCTFKNFYYTGLSLRQCADVTIQNSVFDNHNTNAIALTKEVKNVTIQSCLFTNNYYHSINGENSDFTVVVENVKVLSNTIIGAGMGSAISFAYPVASGETDFIKYRDLLVVDNYITDVFTAISTKIAENVTIQSNVVKNVPRCIYILSSNSAQKGFLIKDNRMYANGLASGDAVSMSKLYGAIIEDNYIYASNAQGISAVGIANSSISRNFIDGAGSAGIRLNLANGEWFNNKVFANTIRNTVTRGIHISAGQAVYLHLKDNVFIEDRDTPQMGVGVSFTSESDYTIIEGCIFRGEITPFGSTNIGPNVIFRGNEGYKLERLTAAPTTGTWKRGDLVWNSNPSNGSPVGWVCVSAGSPGTWQSTGIVGISKMTNQLDSTATTVELLKTDFNSLLAKLRSSGLM